MVGDAINDLRIYNHRTKNNQVWNELADFHTAKENWKSPLLVERNAVQSEKNRQRVFVNLLVQPMTELVQNIKRKTDDLFRLGFQKQLGFAAPTQIWPFIRVHLCPSVVELNRFGSNYFALVDVAVNHAASAGGDIDPAVNARVADDHWNVGAAVLVLVVVNAHPRLAGVVGTVTGVTVVDAAEQENGGKVFSGRGFAETHCVRAADAGDFCEGNAAVG